MTSVPKPLKYLRPHFSTLKEIYEKWGDGENKVSKLDLKHVCPVNEAVFHKKQVVTHTKGKI